MYDGLTYVHGIDQMFVLQPPVTDLLLQKQLTYRCLVTPYGVIEGVRLYVICNQ